MPNTDKATSLKKAQQEVLRLEKLKQDILGRMPKKSTFVTKQLIKLLEKQLEKLDDKLLKARKDLEEATQATDMVEPRVLGRISGILVDIAEGRSDEALDKVKDLGKEVVKDKVEEVLDDKIKDETVRETIKESVGSVIDGDEDEALERLKRGAKDKAKEEVGEILDDKIKDETVRETIKESVGSVIDGDEDEALERLKRGAKDKAKEEVWEILDDKIKDETVRETLKNTIGSVIEGDKDGALEHLEDGAKKKAKEKVGEVIDDKIKDETVREALKGAAGKMIDGDKDGALDVLKDGAKDKTGEIVDDLIEDEALAEAIKEVLGDVIDGRFDDALEKVKDVAKAYAEGKLDDWIEELLKRFKGAAILKLEERAGIEVQAAIPLMVKKKEQEQEPTWKEQFKKLAVNILKRLRREAIPMIKAEIKLLVENGGLDTLVQIAKESAIEELTSGIKGRKLMQILKDILKGILGHPEFKKLVQGIKERVLRKLITIVEEETEKALGGKIDAFLRVYGNWKGPLLFTGKRDVKIGPFWGCINIALSIQASLVVELDCQRKGFGATGRAGVTGSIHAGVGINVGFEVPYIGGVSIEGGLQGGPEVQGSAGLSMSMKNAVVDTQFQPFKFDVDMVTSLYLETPIPNYILKYVPAYFESIKVADQTLLYPLGRLSILVVETPSYSLTFDTVKGKYNYVGSTGKYKMELNPTVKRYIKEIKEAIEEAAQEATDYLNPTKWDLNPFDEDGWIGSLF